VHLLGALLAGEDGGAGLRLDLGDDGLDLAGGLLGALGQLADLGGDDGEATAVSMAALRASRLVWSARSSITTRIRPISWPFSPSDSARVAIELTRSAIASMAATEVATAVRPSSACRSVSAA
jgi:hypothetical protein